MIENAVATEPSPRTRQALRLFAGLSRRYDLMAEALSFGQNRRWRRFLVSRIAPPPNGRALDVATGTGAVAIDLVRAHGCVVVGIDQSGPMLRAGARVVGRAQLSASVRLVLGQGERLPFADARFDAVTFTYLLRYVDDPAAVLAELSRVLRPGGTMAGLEFHVPDAAALQTLWRLYTRIGLPLAGALVSRSWYEVGRFLGPSISEFYRRYPLEEQLEWWRAVGISDVQARRMSFRGGVVLWGRKERKPRHGR